jgi:predicted GNAT superfamily acetyltransferase
MKCHQRLWALEHSIPVISWTFDPLVRRNLRVNMLKLGCEVRGYERNFYGRMDDDYDFIDESDRVFAWWVVDSERANSAALGRLRALSREELAARPDAVIITIPEDIVALRERDIDEGVRWRMRVREQMESALAQGYRVTNLTDAGDYVMERAEGAAATDRPEASKPEGTTS